MPFDDDEIDRLMAEFEHSIPQQILMPGDAIVEVTSNSALTSDATGENVICRFQIAGGGIANLEMTPIAALRLGFSLLSILNHEGQFKISLEARTPSGRLLQKFGAKDRRKLT